MPLPSAPPPDTTSYLLADWLELAAFATVTGQISVEDLNEALEIEEDFEPEEIHTEDDIREARMQAAISAIEERRRVMGEAYPFSLSEDGYRLALDLEWNVGRAAYLLCLLLSHAGKQDGFLSDGPLPDLGPARDLFQICATLCAAGACGGPAFSFGWPRPDKSRFHEKLLQIFEHFGDGKPYELAPPGSPPKIKDGGIDVIAWSHEPDNKPGKLYLLGQAASGRDWKDKSVRQYVDSFHDFWFKYRPASKPTAALFIPFCFPSSHDDAGRVEHFGQEAEYDGDGKYLIDLLGIIYYRYRIPRHAERAVALAESGIGPIERLESVKEVSDWVMEARRLLVAEER